MAPVCRPWCWGARVNARDSKGYWYRAQTPDERREPSEQFRVRFTGFTDKDAEQGILNPDGMDKKRVDVAVRDQKSISGRVVGQDGPQHAYPQVSSP